MKHTFEAAGQKLTLSIGTYNFPPSIAILVYDQKGELYSDLSTNITSPFQNDRQFYANLGSDIIMEMVDVLIKDGVIEEIGEDFFSGFNTYRLYRYLL